MTDPLVQRLYADLSLAAHEVQTHADQLDQARVKLDRLKRLVLDMKGQYPELFDEQLPGTELDDATWPTPVVVGQRQGQDAVITIMREHGGDAMSTTELLKELK